MLDKCEIVDKDVTYAQNNENLMFGVTIEKNNVKKTHIFYKKELEDLDSLIEKINNEFFIEDVSLKFSFLERVRLCNALKKFKEELSTEIKKELDEKEVEEFVEKLTLFRWVLENEEENRIYNLGWDKDKLEKELIEMYRKRAKKNDIKNN